jgi:hypothetical protein
VRRPGLLFSVVVFATAPREGGGGARAVGLGQLGGRLFVFAVAPQEGMLCFCCFAVG